ncbi:MAG: phytanoyl-CoA dioxygenase family protein [Kiritimatiellales bacterium]|nr:phytanoyl-CoA dioxygenase family protein [Kiritimatiellales bacterium]
MAVKVCKDELVWGVEIDEMRIANDLLGDPEALRDRLETDGYLLIREFHPRDEVLAARRALLEAMEVNGLKSISPHNRDLARLPELLRVLESPRLFSFFKDYFGEEALTFDEKWLRTVPNGGYTGLHFDTVYMGRGSNRLHTTWTPLGDLTKELGTLAVWTGDAGELAELRRSYGAVDVDRDKVGGWLSHSPKGFLETFGGRWVTTNVRAGDVIVINMFTMHCSTTNVTDELRMSCDIRFQPASDSADERWYGENRTGHYSTEEHSIGELLQSSARSGKMKTYLGTL